MTLLSVLSCAALLWRLLTTRTGSMLVDYLRRLAPSEACTRCAAISLVPLYAGQLALDALKSRYENVSPQFAWLKALPLPVFDWRGAIPERTATPHSIFTALGLTIGILQTMALAVIVIAMRREPRTLGHRVVAALASALAMLSLVAPALSSTDPYEYVATGMLGLRAYAPPDGAFIGTAYEAIGKHIPLTGVIYGPLWVLIDTAQTAFGSSIYAKIEAIRLWNIGFIGLTLWLLARAGLSRVALIAFALNPALWYFAVAVPHADIEAIALLAATYACARRSKTALAMTFLIAAGLVKLPFVIVGGALLAPLASAKQRSCVWFAAAAIVIGISSLVPRGAYVADLSLYAKAGLAYSLHWVVFAPILATLTLLLLVRGRGYFGVAWLFHQMAPAAAPWYLLWGMPYAIATAGFELYLVAFPLAATQTGAVSTASTGLAFVGIMILTLDVCASRYRYNEPALTSN